jgi:hypothetical protein
MWCFSLMCVCRLLPYDGCITKETVEELEKCRHWRPDYLTQSHLHPGGISTPWWNSIQPVHLDASISTPSSTKSTFPLTCLPMTISPLSRQTLRPKISPHICFSLVDTYNVMSRRHVRFRFASLSEWSSPHCNKMAHSSSPFTFMQHEWDLLWPIGSAETLCMHVARPSTSNLHLSNWPKVCLSHEFHEFHGNSWQFMKARAAAWRSMTYHGALWGTSQWTHGAS